MNQKGFFNDNQNRTEKIKNFFRESGFYILVVVGLCVLAVGTVYFTTRHLITSPEEYEGELVPEGVQAEAEGNKEIVILDDKEGTESEALQGTEAQEELRTETNLPTDPEDPLVAENSDNVTGQNEPIAETIAKPTIAPAATAAPADTNKTKKAEAEGESQEVIKLFQTKPDFILPVEGKIATDYAMDRLIYSKTLDEWRAHSGIDFSAARGEAVKAVADGFIKEIKTDPCYGITIIVEHESGYKSIYSNLASDSMVSVNQKVKAGDAISSVGNTAIFECMDPPHLHFEIVKGDKLIDPKTLLPVASESAEIN